MNDGPEQPAEFLSRLSGVCEYRAISRTLTDAGHALCQNYAHAHIGRLPGGKGL